MAVVQNALIGRSKQSVGGVTFSTWKGRNVLKGKAVSVANPKTTGQVAQRGAFANCVRFYATFKFVLQLAFIRLAGNITAANRFCKLNIKAFVAGSDPAVFVTPADLVLSSGDLGVFSNAVVTSLGLGSFNVDLTYNANPNKGLVTDMIRVVSFCGESFEMMYNDSPAEASFSVGTPGMTAVAGTVHIWAFSFSTTGSSLSDSVYLGAYTY